MVRKYLLPFDLKMVYEYQNLVYYIIVWVWCVDIVVKTFVDKNDI